MSNKWIRKIPLLTCIGLYVWHFIVIERYAVNIPYWDDWAMVHPNALSAKPSLKWLFAWHSEHRILTTRLLVWALYRIDGWNLIVHQLVNYVLYGVLVASIFWFARKTAPKLDAWIILSFLVFLLSPINYENHTWGIQVVYHFALLFFIGAAYFLFHEIQSWTRLVSGSTLTVLAIYSYSSGVSTCSVLLVIFVLFKLTRAFSARFGNERNRELAQLGLVLGIGIVAFTLWVAGFKSPDSHPSPTLPNTLLFWRYFANVVSLGFGFETVASRWGILCLMIVLTPIIGEWWKKGKSMHSSSWSVFAIILGLLASLAAISIGRAGFGLAGAKNSRYAEIGLMLIPFSILAWSIFLGDRYMVGISLKPSDRAQETHVHWTANVSLNSCVTVALWVFCLLGFWSNWDFSYYKVRNRNRMAGLECVKRHYEHGGDAFCPTLYPRPIPERLEYAKQLNLSFYRDIRSHKNK